MFASQFRDVVGRQHGCIGEGFIIGPHQLWQDRYEVWSHNKLAMLSSKVPGNLPRISKFAVTLLLKPNRKGLDRLRHHLTHQPHYHTGVDSPAQKCTQRHLAHQAHPYSILQKYPSPFDSRRLVILAHGYKGQFPVASGADLSIFINQDVRCRELKDAIKECVRRRHTQVCQVFVESKRVHFAWDTGLKQRLDLRSKDQSLPIPVVIERLLAKAISCSQKTPPSPIPKGKGKHPPQLLNAVITVFLISMNNCFSIRRRLKMVPAFLEDVPQLTIVINFSIENNQNAPVFIENGLVTADQVDDRQAAHTHGHAITHPDPLVIRPTMSNDLTHAVYKLSSIFITTLCINKSGYSTHSNTILSHAA